MSFKKIVFVSLLGVFIVGSTAYAECNRLCEGDDLVTQCMNCGGNPNYPCRVVVTERIPNFPGCSDGQNSPTAPPFDGTRCGYANHMSGDRTCCSYVQGVQQRCWTQ